MRVWIVKPSGRAERDVDEANIAHARSLLASGKTMYEVVEDLMSHGMNALTAWFYENSARLK